MTADVAPTRPAHDAPSRWRRGRWLARRLGIALVVLVCVAGLLWWIALRRAKAQVAAEMARVRAAGEPLTAAELDAWCAIPPGEPDSTAAWAAVLGWVEDHGASLDGPHLPIIGDADPPAPGEPWPELLEVHDYIHRNRDLFRLVETAAATPGPCRLPGRLSEGVFDHGNALLPRINLFRRVAQVLCLKAMLETHIGQADAAARTTEQVYATSRLLQREPCVIPLLVRFAIASIAVASAERIVEEGSASDAALHSLSDALRSDWRDALYAATLGERIWGLEVFEMPDAADASGALIYFTGYHEKVIWLRLMADYIDATRGPWPAPLIETRTINRRFVRNSQASFSNKWTTTFSSTFAPATGAETSVAARMTASESILQVLIALELHRRQHGTLPATLDALVPDFLPSVPIDPRDGRPLRYRLEPDAAVVWSIGEDARDDGGVVQQNDYPDQVRRLRLKPPAVDEGNPQGEAPAP